VNSTQLHYREASHLLDVASALQDAKQLEASDRAVAEAQVHASLAVVAALHELTRQADPEAVASAVGVLRPLRSTT
jgi:hypothetical protein